VVILIIMSTELIGGIYTREFLDADFAKTIANQSLYHSLSLQRKEDERRKRNTELYIKQQILHGKYKPSEATKKRMEEYMLNQMKKS
jgi:hypothetical protein